MAESETPQAIIDFLAKLDVKEIHGYRPEIGLSVFTQAALDRQTPTTDNHDGRRPTNGPLSGQKDLTQQPRTPRGG